MKIKIRKKFGEYQVIVNDKAINAMYEHNQDNPIVLASLSQYDTTGFWILKDLRLKSNASGYSSIAGSTSQIYKYDTDVEYKNLIEQLHYYICEKNYVLWNTFDGVVFPGNKLGEISKNILVPKTGEFSWSYTEAKKHLKDIALYWEQYNESDNQQYLANISITNNYRQISEMTYQAKIMGEKDKKLKANKKRL